ncbi:MULTISPECIES: putative selenate reductase subunit YgfK [Rahnella]|uniref:dihydrouracil dehydrogenase (NAD(+)) n=1 Tax=Rahnella laticis TaxID=2787622 RepID=A0ABS0E7L1_9GAMM|nr:MULTISPECIES: putative selenate reductase subunit YgfK [Rahnella]MBF7981083.1 putative selenate reductase subunit YgfK [Rahnella laticis]MBF8001155.1 putative selenate reductase subunit YgfK [Rahnella sp. LAC-M12]
MGDIMRPIPFGELLSRIFEEYKENKSIFGIPEKQFYRQDAHRLVRVFNETCETPIGPAAGPHTQLAQNIVTAWLTGGRFIELKTVQILDRLELEKPCIDAEDEGFNTEWSTEYTLSKAHDEYLKAWFVLYLLEEIFSPRQETQAKSFIFNMSVGYDLKGIQQPAMQSFIHDMMDSSHHPKYSHYRNVLQAFVEQYAFPSSLNIESKKARLNLLTERIPANMVSGLTLSTMHGCPPTEIEAICQYMLEEKGLHTFVKLNPTLLGYTRVREILDGCGFGYIKIDPVSFEHDLKLDEAKAMLHRLLAVAARKKLNFGVKLTNTLGTVNTKGRLPGGEMYMSGRALFPLSINVALVLAQAFNGKLAISYSGGASQVNIRQIFDTGIRPITLATDLLKPGGYLRQTQCLQVLEQSECWNMTDIDLPKLEALAKQSLSMPYTQKEWKSPEEIDAGGPLPQTDCYVAPCVSACAISQDIPGYIHLMGENRYEEALELIYRRNALPAITGHICDHQCQNNCTRLDYDSALNIREMKKIALEKGWEGYSQRWHKPAGSGEKNPVAVIGAGPAGLAAGYFLSRAGHAVTLFEREPHAGGVVKNIIPHFRIPAEAILHDIDFVAAHGVKFAYGCRDDLTINMLHQQGFKYVCIGIGAGKNSGLSLKGDNGNVLKSFDFLRKFNQEATLSLGRNVVVIGAGNTAMDCARAARRVPGVQQVTILYRRSMKEMPAWREEYLEALKDNVQFRWLVNPEHYAADGTLTGQVMALGEPDEKGRRRPEFTGETVTLHADCVITAIGEQPDMAALTALGVPLESDGLPQVSKLTLETGRENVFLMGDVQHGPSSIVAAMGDARRVTDCILAREQKVQPSDSGLPVKVSEQDIYARKGLIQLNPVHAKQRNAFVMQEAARCLECHYVCSKCVDVCPNRANVSIAVPGFKDKYQTLHLDASCNECGNCAQFCPWRGKPYKDKVTVFSLEADFVNSTNPGFYLEGKKIHARQGGKVYALLLDSQGRVKKVPEGLEDLCRIITQVTTNHRYLLGQVEA